MAEHEPLLAEHLSKCQSSDYVAVCRLGVFEKIAECLHGTADGVAALGHLDEQLLAARLFDLGDAPAFVLVLAA